MAAAYWFVHFRAVSGRLAKSPDAAGSGAAEERSRLIPLTSYPGEEMWPTFSPDGNQIAFSYREPGNSTSHLFIKLIGQDDAIQLTRGPAADFFPAWSPDGRWIAFLRNSGPQVEAWPVGSGWALMLIPAIGGPERKLAEIAPTGDYVDRIFWHRGGKWIATVDRGASGAYDTIHIISVGDGTKRQLTTPEPGSAHSSPAFAPDGKSIVFTRSTPSNSEDLYLLELSGDLTPSNAPRRLTFDNDARQPAWMPDGRSVLYSRFSPSLWRVRVSPNGTATQLEAQSQMRVARYITKPPDLEEFLQIGLVLKDVLAQSLQHW